MEQIANQLFLANIKFACGDKHWYRRYCIEASTSVTETVRRQWRRHITLGICRVLLVQQCRRTKKKCPEKEYNIEKKKIDIFYFYFFRSSKINQYSDFRDGGKRNTFRRGGMDEWWILNEDETGDGYCVFINLNEYLFLRIPIAESFISRDNGSFFLNLLF